MCKTWMCIRAQSPLLQPFRRKAFHSGETWWERENYLPMRNWYLQSTGCTRWAHPRKCAPWHFIWRLQDRAAVKALLWGTAANPSAGRAGEDRGRSFPRGICAGVTCSAKPPPAAPAARREGQSAPKVVWAPETMNSSPMDTDSVSDEGVTTFRWLSCGSKCVLSTPSTFDNGHWVFLIRKDYTWGPEALMKALDVLHTFKQMWLVLGGT